MLSITVIDEVGPISDELFKRLELKSQLFIISTDPHPCDWFKRFEMKPCPSE